MKKLIYISLALSFFFASCSKEAENGLTETVVVNLCPEIPGMMATRAAEDLTVNKLVCAVFDEDQEIVVSETITIIDPADIHFSPRLIKGRTYDVVFWAMKDGNYDVSDLTAIVRSSNGSLNEADYDAFTATTNIKVDNSVTVPVTLTRPLAQLNIGVTEEDWDAVVALGQTPASTSISYESYDAFNALTGGLLTRNHGSITRTAPASGTFDVGSTTYKSLGSFYVFVDGTTEKRLSDIKFTIKDESGDVIRSNVQIEHVPIQRNYKTNIVGGLLTGTITYNISLGGFADQDKNQTL